ncbi:hypothetical protein [Maribellus sp. YY47]|uniref:hypothetical protein n=1 Tax=Maribellus sp. YY47 TaxID=2929486 RepID=UPI002001B847|nr:hypothetical protein [Maribellus sp. YY47]MCK3684169.1 hypothetical protein [Maribellus sp. YY47]
MKYIKQNKNWNAEPNAPRLAISQSENWLELSFLLNSFTFEHIDEGETGKLAFFEAYAYRLDSTNDEAYQQGKFRFKNSQLPWGEFYELIDSKGDRDFPADKIVVDESVSKKKIRHFIFFLRDGIFECLANDFKFSFIHDTSDILEEKYPKGYLNHYIAMFASVFDKPSVDNFKTYTDLYLQMESKKEFADLKNELKNIKRNNDLNLYLKYANDFQLADFGRKQLDDMIKVIENYKV